MESSAIDRGFDGDAVRPQGSLDSVVKIPKRLGAVKSLASLSAGSPQSRGKQRSPATHMTVGLQLPEVRGVPQGLQAKLSVVVWSGRTGSPGVDRRDRIPRITRQSLPKDVPTASSSAEESARTDHGPGVKTPPPPALEGLADQTVPILPKKVKPCNAHDRRGPIPHGERCAARAASIGRNPELPRRHSQCDTLSIYMRALPLST